MSKVAVESVFEHLKQLVEHVEEIVNIRLSKKKLREEILELLRPILEQIELRKVEIPSTAYGALEQPKHEEIEYAAFDRAGVLHVKPKGKDAVILGLSEISTEHLIAIFNILIPVLREKVAEKLTIVEHNLEALQAIKSGLTKIEKKK